MQGFIEVTRKEDGKKILLNISGIDGVFPEAKGAFVSMRGNIALFASNKVSGYFVEETYWEVKGRGTFVSTESKSKRDGKYYYGAFVKESYEEIKSKLEG